MRWGLLDLFLVRLFKWTLIKDEGMDEDQLVQLIKDRNYEMLLLTLWVMHTYLPSEKLRGKVYERFFKAVSYGSSSVGRLLPLAAFQEDLRDRLKVYTCAYDKLRFHPSVGVDEFGGMIAQVIRYLVTTPRNHRPILPP